MPMSEGKGPIVSIENLSIGFRVDSTNREARMILCLTSIFCRTVLYELLDVVPQVCPICAIRS